MKDATRRGFLKVAGAGAVAATLVPAGIHLAEGSRSASSTVAGSASAAAVPATASGSMMAYVHDVSKGEIVVMIEGREVTVVDRQLVAKLATAVHTASPITV